MVTAQYRRRDLKKQFLGSKVVELSIYPYSATIEREVLRTRRTTQGTGNLLPQHLLLFCLVETGWLPSGGLFFQLETLVSPREGWIGLADFQSVP